MSSLIKNCNNNSRRVFHLLSSKKTYKITNCAVILLIFCLMTAIHGSTCPSSSSTSDVIASEQCSFSGYADSQTYNVALGPVSASLYYLYYINTPGNSCGIRKTNPDGTLAWMAALSFRPIVKGLSIDTLEQYVYVGSYTNPLNVIRLGAGTGSIVDAQRYSFLNGGFYDIKIHPLSDGSGYYVAGADSSVIANICKYLFSSPSNSGCQQISNFKSYAYGQLKVSDSSMFMLGSDPLSPYQLHLYKHTFGGTSPDWSLKLSCPSGTCTVTESESQLISSSIYTFFTYGSSYRYVYMAVISVSDGTVNNRYKASMTCVYVLGLGVNGDYIAVSVHCNSDFLLIFNRATNLFDIKLFAGLLYGIGIDTTGRFVITATMSNNGYISKFMAQSISAHPDFQTAATWTMNLLASGTEDIVADSGQTIGAVSTQTVSAPTYTNLTVTYVTETSYTSDINFLAKDQSISVIENTKIQKSPDLPCSISGATPIVFSISDYITTAPSWVTIDSTLGVLTIMAPEVNSDTEYDFYINSSLSGFSNPVKKLIKLTVINCTPSNCQKCISTSESVCEICNSGYDLASGTCVIQNTKAISNTAQALSTTTTSAVAATTGVVAFTSLVSTASIASLWMTINQLQLFFLFELTRAFLPKNIQAVIEGSYFALNIYEYIPIRKLSFSLFLLNKFEFELSDQRLNSLGIKYDSTIANTYPILNINLLMIILCIFIYLFKLLFKKLKESNCCSCIFKIPFWISDKIFQMMIFSFFIRNILQSSQFILISSIYEISKMNTTSLYRSISLSFSILAIILYVIVIIILQYLTFSSYKLIEGKHNMLGEFFCGLKVDRKHKFYSTIHFLRRALFVLLLVTCTSIHSKVLIAILSSVQLAYVIYLSCVRPYVEVKGNLIEILNEIYYGVLLAALFILNTESDWTSLKTSIYMWTQVSNTFVVFIVVVVFPTISIGKWICKRCCRKQKSRNNEYRENENVENSVIRDLNRVVPMQHRKNATANRILTNKQIDANSNVSIQNSSTKEESKSNLNLNTPIRFPNKRYYWRDENV